MIKIYPVISENHEKIVLLGQNRSLLHPTCMRMIPLQPNLKQILESTALLFLKLFIIYFPTTYWFKFTQNEELANFIQLKKKKMEGRNILNSSR